MRLISHSWAYFNCYPKFHSPKRHNGIDVRGITPGTPLCTLHTGLEYGALHTYRSSQTLIQSIRANQAKSTLCLICPIRLRHGWHLSTEEAVKDGWTSRERTLSFRLYNLWVYCLGEYIYLSNFALLCSLVLSHLALYQVSVRRLESLATWLPSSLPLLTTTCCSLRLVVITRGWS